MLVRALYGSFAVLVALGAAGIAQAQTGSNVHGGLSSNGGTISAPNVNTVNGINPNGTPRETAPGASMTVGAGNSTMIPGIAGGANEPPITTPGGAPPAGIAVPTINGQPATAP
jgi:hypothetical protein